MKDTTNPVIPSGPEGIPESDSLKKETAFSFDELERRIYFALETYSNVHRGSGHKSQISTQIYEDARKIVLWFLGIEESMYDVIFCSPLRASILESQLRPGTFFTLSSNDIGLAVGIRAIAVERKALPERPVYHSGGGTTRLVSADWIIWAGAPERFEAGTPAIINAIAFTVALKMLKSNGKEAFIASPYSTLSPENIIFHDDLEELSGQQLLEKLRLTMVGRGIPIPTTKGTVPFVNLDNAASTPAFEPVWQTFCKTWRQPRQVQQEIVPLVQSVCAEAFGAPEKEYEVLFTLNTTEAINIVAKGLTGESRTGTSPVVVTTFLEHNSNDLPWRMVLDSSLIRLSVDANGFFDLAELENHLSDYNQKCLYGEKRINLVAVSGASNVLGIFNDLKAVSSIVHRYGAQLLVDAAQMAAHRKIDVEQTGIDYLVFSGHKMYAPFGTGVLIAKKELLKPDPIQLAQIRASGEENSAGIAALGKAILLLKRIGFDLIMREEQNLTGMVLDQLTKTEGITIHGIKDPGSEEFACKGGVISFSVKNIMPDKISGQLAFNGGIGTRYGCHCSHLLVKRILHVPKMLEGVQWFLLKIFPRIALPGVARISLGIENDQEEIERFIRTIREITFHPGNKKHDDFRRTSENKYSKSEVKFQIKALADSISGKVYGE
jgi:selenocysteine lyase/cysteine desulfurase